MICPAIFGLRGFFLVFLQDEKSRANNFPFPYRSISRKP